MIHILDIGSVYGEICTYTSENEIDQFAKAIRGVFFVSREPFFYNSIDSLAFLEDIDYDGEYQHG